MRSDSDKTMLLHFVGMHIASLDHFVNIGFHFQTLGSETLRLRMFMSYHVVVYNVVKYYVILH